MRHTTRRRILAIPIIVILSFAAMAATASAAGAATCGNGTVNLNVGSGCASVLGVPVVGGSTSGETTACTDSGCNTVKTETPPPATPTITHTTPAPKRSTPHHTYVRKAPAPVALPRHINSADADTSFFYSGSYNRALPYPSFSRDIFRPEPATRIVPSIGFHDWDFGPMGRNLALSILAGLMLIVGAGGVRRLMSE